MRRMDLVLVMGLAVCLGCGGGAVLTVSQPVQLVYKETPQPLSYRADLSVTTDEGGRELTWVSSFKFTMVVDEMKPDGAIKRSFQFSDFAVTEYAGGTPEPDPDVGEYEGETLWLELDAQGKVVDWKGLDAIKGRVPSGPRFKDYIVYVLFRMFQPLPSQTVSAGSTWESTFETTLRMKNNDVTLKGTEDHMVEGFGTKAGRDCAKIDTDIRVDGQGDKTVGTQEELSLLSEEQGDGQIWFDYGGGVVAEFTAKTSTTQTSRYERAGREDVATDYISLDAEMKIRLQ